MVRMKLIRLVAVPLGVFLGSLLGVWAAGVYADSLPKRSGWADLYRLYGTLLAVMVLVPIGGLCGGMVVWFVQRLFRKRNGAV